MAVLTTVGRAALAAAVKARPLHLAWGTGDPAWDANPIPELLSATELLNELGRVEATVVGYATPDENGEIQVPTGTFTASEAPTNYLHLHCDFGFDDAPNDALREAGLFMDSVIVEELPAGQRYFVPAELEDPGSLLALEYFPKVERSALVRQSFEFVLVI